MIWRFEWIQVGGSNQDRSGIPIGGQIGGELDKMIERKSEEN